MKKLHYLALAAITLALFACNSKPAESDQQSEEQVETTLEQAEEFVEQALEAGEPLVEGALDSLASEEAPSETEEAPVSEEQSAEEPAPEQPAEQAAPEEPAVPSDKYEIAGSDGNYVAFRNKVVTADADGCVDVAFVFDKIEQSKVRLIVRIETLEGQNVGLFPIGVEPGGTKAHVPVCASLGGVFSKITPGEKYQLSFHRAVLQ
jgi:hypothetical protein